MASEGSEVPSIMMSGKGAAHVKDIFNPTGNCTGAPLTSLMTAYIECPGSGPDAADVSIGLVTGCLKSVIHCIVDAAGSDITVYATKITVDMSLNDLRY